MNVSQLKLRSEKFDDDDDDNNSNKDITVLWNQAVHTDREVTANMPDIIIKKTKRKNAH